MKIIVKKLANGVNEALFTYVDAGIKVTKKLGLNEVIELDDELCYQMLAEYKGVFEVWKYLRPHQRAASDVE
jgi:hypothetical protein